VAPIGFSTTRRYRLVDVPRSAQIRRNETGWREQRLERIGAPPRR
jgi:hypothetical protein